jgi:hypothetical protein
MDCVQMLLMQESAGVVPQQSAVVVHLSNSAEHCGFCDVQTSAPFSFEQ